MLQASKSVEEAARNAFGYYEFLAGPTAAIAAMNRSGQDGFGSMRKGINNAVSAYKNYNPVKHNPIEYKEYVEQPVSIRVKWKNL